MPGPKVWVPPCASPHQQRPSIPSLDCFGTEPPPWPSLPRTPWAASKPPSPHPEPAGLFPTQNHSGPAVPPPRVHTHTNKSNLPGHPLAPVPALAQCPCAWSLIQPRFLLLPAVLPPSPPALPPGSPQTFACALLPVPGVGASRSPREGYPPASVSCKPRMASGVQPCRLTAHWTRPPLGGLHSLHPRTPLLSVTPTPRLCSAAPDAPGSRGDASIAQKARWRRAQLQGGDWPGLAETGHQLATRWGVAGHRRGCLSGNSGTKPGGILVGAAGFGESDSVSLLSGEWNFVVTP